MLNQQQIFLMKKDIIAALTENMRFQITYFAHYVPAMQVLREDSTILCTDICDDTFNIVIDAHFSEKQAYQKIDTIVGFFHKKNLPFSWWTGPLDQPMDLKNRLLAKGFFAKENDYGMYLDLNMYHISTMPQQLEIRQVSTIDDLHEFDQVHVQASGNPQVFDIIFSKIPSSAYRGKAPYRFYTGYRNGKAVTTGVVVFHAHVVGIYFILTLPQERRKGYATEMMHYLLSIAKNEHQKTAILQASEEGKKVYEKLGFKECCLFQEFALENSINHS